VRAYDPIAEEEARKLMTGVEFADSALEAVQGADAIVLVTEWPEFAELDWSRVAEATPGRIVVDGRNFVDRAAVEGAGFVYEGIGR
jgi:UDPglucose 6-dehydrogenase